MAVSENGGTPKSSILIGFSIIHHPFWGTSIFGNTHMNLGLSVKLGKTIQCIDEVLTKQEVPRRNQSGAVLAVLNLLSDEE